MTLTLDMIKTILPPIIGGQILTISQLNRALYDVRNELEVLGLYDIPMADVEVFLVPLGDYFGQQWMGGGPIEIPMVSTSRIKELINGGSSTSLRDVIRHEYGHAFADTHRKLIRAKPFADAYDAPHFSEVEWVYDPKIHVSEYAATSPMEDFAETFMEYLWRKGRLPKKWDTPNIKPKWQYIDWLQEQTK